MLCCCSIGSYLQTMYVHCTMPWCSTSFTPQMTLTWRQCRSLWQAVLCTMLWCSRFSHLTHVLDLASVQVSLAACALYNALVQQIFPHSTCFGPGISFTGRPCSVQRSGAADFPTEHMFWIYHQNRFHWQPVHLYGSSRGVLMGFARKPKGADAEKSLLITAELQEAAVVDAHLLLYQIHCRLHFCHFGHRHIVLTGVSWVTGRCGPLHVA